MAKAKIMNLEQTDSTGLFTIIFDGESQTEFDKFVEKFRDDAVRNKDLRAIINQIELMMSAGAFLERRFRPEGKMRDHVSALPVFKNSLRLYCLRMSDSVLIVGNGGVKNTKTYEESKELSGYVLTLQNFDRLIKEGVKDGTIMVSENKIETDKTFDL